MPEEKQNINNLVKSIFSRRTNKLVSTLFNKSISPKSKEDRPSKRRTYPLALDIGTNSLKLLGFIPTKAGFILKDFLLEEFSQDIILNPEKKKDAIQEFLKRVFREKDLSDEVYLSLSTACAQIRNLRFPYMPYHEVESACVWELRQSGFPHWDEMSFDYIILNENQDKAKEVTEVLAIVAAKKDVLEYLDYLRPADLKAVALDSDPLSIISSLDFSGYFNPLDIVVVLELGAGISSLNIVANRQLHLSRNLNFTGNSINQAIRDYLKVDSKEAEEIKRNLDLLEPREDLESLFKEVIEPHLENLITDIEHTFKYYSYQLTQSRVGWFNRIILSGGLSLWKNLTYFLNKRLNIPVEVGDCLRSLELSEEVESQYPYLKEIAPRLNVGLGLCLRSIKPR